MKTADLSKDGRVLIERVELAVRIDERMKGLLGRRQSGRKEAMWLSHCSGVHTWFMAFNIDLYFFDHDMEVVKIVRDVAPWQIVSGGRRAVSVLETTTGYLSDGLLGKGDCVSFVGRL